MSSETRYLDPLSIIVIASLFIFCLFAISDLETANQLTGQWRDAVLKHFDWLFVTSANVALGVCLLLVFHPKSKQRLGPDKPEFSRLAWFAMLFSAGLASGILYWGVSEPMMHFASNPFQTASEFLPASLEAARSGTIVTIFHWGLHGWGFYVLVALAISLSAYRFGNDLNLSSALIPIFGKSSMDALGGKAINLLAVYGTVFGVATSLGLAVSAMNATLAPLLGIEQRLDYQIAILITVSLLGTLSAMSGIDKGVRTLSEINIWISLALLVAVFILGPSLFLGSFFFTNLWFYGQEAFPMGVWLADSVEDKTWQGAWTIFYWGWWLAWTPFVGLFIARISKGRTIREFILGVLLVPTFMIILWMSVFGGTGLHQELAEAGSISTAVNENYANGLAITFQRLAESLTSLPTELLVNVLLAVVSFLLFTWLITSLDSATLVICHSLSKADSMWMKVFWGMMIGLVTCTLILIDGVTALQAVSIIIGLPMAVLVILIAVSVVKMMQTLEADSS